MVDKSIFVSVADIVCAKILLPVISKISACKLSLVKKLLLIVISSLKGFGNIFTSSSSFKLTATILEYSKFPS